MERKYDQCVVCQCITEETNTPIVVILKVFLFLAVVFDIMYECMFLL